MNPFSSVVRRVLSREFIRFCWVAACAFLVSAAPAAAASLTPYALQCDSAENPLGVDSAPPRLSWKLKSDARGARQTAWQVLVASSVENLARGAGDVWDSGTVKNDAQLGINYGGRALRSAERVFWKVRVWDGAGNVSAWSEPATWTMGLLAASDWQAHWITHPAQLERLRPNLGFHSENARDPNTVKWIQLDLGASRRIDEVKLHALRRNVTERLGFPQRFKLEVADEPEFRAPRMVVDSTGKDFANEWVSDYMLLVGGVEARYVRITVPQLRVTADVASLAFSQIEVVSGGKNIAVGTAVSASDSLEQAPWSMAAVVDGLENTGAKAEDSRTIVLRRTFDVRSGLKRALVYSCGLGQQELLLNGRKVGDELLTPGWTDTSKTCLYDTHDLTALLSTGAHDLRLTLAGGMYSVPAPGGRYTKFTSQPRALVAIAQVRLEYADGSVEIVGTDDRWQAALGATTYSHVFAGEDFDARLAARELEWRPAVAAAGPAGTLRGSSHAAPALSAHETLRPVAVKELRPSVKVYDLGQNASIMPRLRVHGVAGAEVKIIPAELVRPDGSVDRASSGGGNAWWRYTLSGRAEGEAWFPSFFYHGSRYLQVELSAPAGAALPEVDLLEGVVVHSASAAIGEFATSDDLFNRIHTLVRWAQRSNMVSVLTDCPHRERLGWLEQYHLNGPALRYEFDLARLYAKTFGDMADAQTAAGLVPDIAPEYTVFSGNFRDSPEWGSAFILAAWQHYVWTGDESVLRQHFDGMQRYVSYLAGKSKADIVSHGLGDWYDLGPNRPGLAQLTPVPVTATAFYFEDTKTLATIARAIGRLDDARRLDGRAAEIKSAFNQAFFHLDTGSYATGSQTANALPLVMEIADPVQRGRVLDALVADVRQRGNGITAGDVGYRYLLRALADGGRSDVIFDLNHQSDKPGYGYQLAHGATSLTEAWNAQRSSSQNHFMLGQINEWFYHDLAGLAPDPAAPGFKNILVRPQPVAGIEWTKAAYESPRGKIQVEWRREPGQFVLAVMIPPNATATVSMPAAAAANVTEGKVVAERSPGVRRLRDEPGAVVYAVEAGSYEFRAPAL